MKTNTVQTSVYLDRDTLYKLKYICLVKGMTVTQVVRELVQKFVDDNGSDVPSKAE